VAVQLGVIIRLQGAVQDREIIQSGGIDNERCQKLQTPPSPSERASDRVLKRQKFPPWATYQPRSRCPTRIVAAYVTRVSPLIQPGRACPLLAATLTRQWRPPIIKRHKWHKSLERLWAPEFFDNGHL
jgi:hypothetical protein